MIDAGDSNLTIEDQCKLIALPRSTFYYSSTGVSAEDLKIMRKMDEMYLEDPTRGTRRFSAELSSSGYTLGRVAPVKVYKPAPDPLITNTLTTTFGIKILSKHSRPYQT